MTPDDGSETGPEGPTRDEVNQLANQLDGTRDVVVELDNRVEQLTDRIDELERELAAERDRRREAVAALRERIADLEDRTDMLGIVREADSTTGQQRAYALLQHMRREAEQRRRDGDQPVSVVDRDTAATALSHPDIDRTTYYDDMRRVVRLVGDEDVCWYDDGELRLDLSDGTVRLPRPKDGRHGDPRPTDGRGASTTETNGVGGRKTGDSAGHDTDQTPT